MRLEADNEKLIRRMKEMEKMMHENEADKQR